MNVILVSGRHTAQGDRHDVDADFARRLATAGCRVRWIVPVASPPGAAPTPGDADRVERITVVTATPPFTAVEGRLHDPALERALAVAIRRELPDVVHVLDYGGAVSVNAGWLAVRLGAPSVVSLRSAPTLCHRGDLVFADGTPCSEWLDPRRCAACCLRPGPGGLSPPSAAVGRLLCGMRWPLHGYPTAMGFENRRELLLGGLLPSARICVDDEAERERILSLGLRREQIAILALAAPEAQWLELYRNLGTAWREPPG